MEDYKDLGFEEETNQEPSKLESLGRGIQQGATLGFSDELSGGIQAALDKLAPFVGLPSVTESNKALLDQGFTGDIGPTDSLYTQARNEERQILREAEKANPKLFGTGELVGSAIIPLGAASTGAKLSTKVAKGALAGGLTGGATSLGTSEELPETSNVVKDTLIGGAIGAAIPLGGAALKGAKKAFKKSELGSDIVDLFKKTRQGVDFSDTADLRGKALSTTKDIVSEVDRSNFNKIQKRDQLLSNIRDVDVKDETVNLLNQLDQLKKEAVATAEPVIKNTEKQIERVFKKGSKVSGEDYKMLEKQLTENIDKAALNKDTRLEGLLKEYQSLIKNKVYEQSPELSTVRRSIRDENEMLKLLTGEAAPDLARLSPAEMEKLAEQTLTRLEAPAGTANYGQSQKFFEGIEKTPGMRGTQVPGFSNMKKSIQLSDELRNLELSKKLKNEGIQSGTASPTGLVSAITGGAGALTRQASVLAGKATRGFDDFAKSIVRDDKAVNSLIPKLVSKGKSQTAKMFQAIANSPDIKKRQALIFAALQQPNVRSDLEELDFQPEMSQDEQEP